ncbi:MAG: hypothetical protein HZB25_03770 [Candidatus Eisenbacteria bacterium]|nr:hypothetical protein [Candidatus Eisenbacteria bacterium]
MRLSAAGALAPAMLLLGAVAGSAWAAMPTGKDVVSVRAVEALSLGRGATDTARVLVTVKPGYHVQANPAAADYLVATQLKVKALPGFKAGKPLYPKGRVLQLEGSDEKLSTFDGSFEIRVPLKAGKTARPGSHALAASLKFQACDDKSCFAPVTVPVQIEVRVEEPRK